MSRFDKYRRLGYRMVGTLVTDTDMSPIAVSSRSPRASAAMAVVLACAALVLLALPRDIEHRVRTTRGGIQRLDADALHEHGTEGEFAAVRVAGSDPAAGLLARAADDDHAPPGDSPSPFRVGPPGAGPAPPVPVPSRPTFDRPLSPSAGRAPPLS
jgi:hypothetical protein